MQDLKNKVVLITGASSGIGAALARAFGASWRESRGALSERRATAAHTLVSQMKDGRRRRDRRAGRCYRVRAGG